MLVASPRIANPTQRGGGQIVSYQQPLPHPRIATLVNSQGCPYLGNRKWNMLTAALPPALRISIPHLAARGCVLETIPFVLCTTLLRLGHFINAADGGGNTEGVVRGMIASESIKGVGWSEVRGSRVYGIIYLQEASVSKERNGRVLKKVNKHASGLPSTTKS